MVAEHSADLLRDFVYVIQEDTDPNTMAANLALRTLSRIDCNGVIIGAIQHEGFLDLIGTYGYPDEQTEPYKRIPLWTPLPITDTARTGEPIILKSPEEMIIKYPHYPEPELGTNLSIVALPIKFRSCVIGAIGFTSKHPPSDEFLTSPITESILALCGLYIQNWKLQKRSSAELNYQSSRSSLSERQKKIMKLFEDDLTTDQIAERLNFSPSTIKQDIIKIYELLGVHSRDHVLEIMKKVDLVG